jgi:hypothetical protein
MTVKQLKSLAVQISNAKHHLDILESQYAAFRLDALREVEMQKNAVSITLLFKGRKINARKNSHNRYVVKEGKTTLKNEYLGGIHDLRFDIARGVI